MEENSFKNGVKYRQQFSMMIYRYLYKQLSNSKMKSSIDIIPNPNLKGLNCIFSTLPSIPPNTVLKLTQNNNAIYTRYNPSSSSASSISTSSNKAELPSKLCELNNIKIGSMQVEPMYNIQACTRLSVYVSKLNWQIINNTASRLEEEFMNQVDLVWKGALIPLYYDKNNCVVLRVECQGLGFLRENSELEVLVEEDKQEDKKQIQKQKEYISQSVAILPISLLPSGNINKIYVLKNHQMFTQPSLKKTIPKKVVSKNENKVQQPQKIQKQQNNLPLPQPIDYANINQNYVFELVYNYEIEISKFPCDTNLVSIKQQLQQIVRMKANQGQPKKQAAKFQKLLVQVEVIEDMDHISRQCYIKTGKQIPTFSCAKQIKKQKAEQQIKQQPEKSQQISKSQSQPQQQYKFQTHTPKPQTQQEIPHNNTLIFNKLLVKHFKINLNQNIKIRRTEKDPQLQNSKKLQYLLSMKDFGIKVCVAEKEDSEKFVYDIKQDVVEEFINRLLKNGDRKDEQKNNKSITLYSKIPYALKSTHNKSTKFGFICLHQNQKPLSDPLTIFYSPSKLKIPKTQPQKQKQQQQDENKHQSEIKEIKNKLAKVVRVENYFYKGENQQENVKVKVGILTKLDGLCWRKGQKVIKQHEENAIGSQGKTVHEIFTELYKICYEQQIKKLLQLLPNPKPDQLPPTPYQTSILITSFSNNGKTVMNNILREHGYQTLYIDISQMDNTSFVLENLTQYLQLVFQLYDGDFLFMDNLDSVCYKIDAGDLHRKQEMIAAKLVIRRIVEYSKVYKKICIFTAKNQANIDEQFQNYELIKLKNPTRQIRAQVLHEYHKNNKVNYDRQKVEEIIENSESMSFGEFSKYIISGHKAEGVGQISKVVDFSKLAGIKDAKKVLRTIVQRPLKYSFVFKRLPIKLSRGVLLYGGSGTGKSAIGQALAGEFKMKFFSVKGSDILSKYIGGSEAAVRDIFEKAMTVSPSIIFFDEFQSIVPRRNSSNTSVTDRVVNQFLCYLDGVASVEGVYIVAASSRPELIDPALLRPGRIDTHIFLDHPTRQQRQQLLNLFKNSINFQTPIQQLLNLTEHYSYSDLIGLIKQLRIKQSARVIKQNQKLLEGGKIDVKQFKFISDQFLREVMGGYKVALSKEVKMKERENFLAFKRGDATDISKQKTMLR